MAVTFLDAVLLQKFTLVFSIVFVIACVYGILQMTGFLGGNKGLQAVIALISGLFVIVVPSISILITFILPWFTFLFIFIIFLLIAYKLFGATDADIRSYVTGDKSIGWIIFIIFAVIFVAGLGQVFGQRLLSGEEAPAPVPTAEGEYQTVPDGTTYPANGVDTPDYKTNLSATLFHPKILGLGFILLLAVLTIAILAKEPV